MSADVPNDDKAAVGQAGSVAPAGPLVAAVDPFGAPLGAPPATAAPRVTLARLWRYRWLALAVFLGFSVPAVAAIWLLYVPMYRAEAAVLVSPRIPRIAFRTDDNGRIPNYDQHLNTEAAKLRDPVVLNRVLERSDVQETSWYRHRPALGLGRPPSLLDRLRDELEARAAQNSSYIFVTMEWEDPGETALIVNAVIQEYERYVAQEFNEDDDVVLRVLEGKLEHLYLDARTLKNDIANLVETAGLYTEDPDAFLQQRRLRLDTKEAELSDLRRVRQAAEFRLEQVHAGEAPVSPGAAVGLPTSAPASQPARHTFYVADPEWRRLNEELKDADFAVKLAQGRYGEFHTEMIKLRTAAEHARDRLRAYQVELDGGPHGQPSPVPGATQGGTLERMSPQALAAYVQNLQSQGDTLEHEIVQERGELKELARNVRELKKQQADLRRLEDQLEILRQNEIAMKTEKARPPAIKTREAFRPSQPVNGKRRYMLMAMALFGGLGLGLAAAYLWASTNRAIYEATDVLGPVEAPFLGYFPWVREPNRMLPQEEAIQAEYVRMVRTALLERVGGGVGSAVLVTSAGTGAGKTTVALSLAKSLALCGKRVLLVDADLRNPSFSTRFAIPAEPGLIGVLTNRATDGDAIVRNGVGGLDVLPAGVPDSSHDPELLADGTFSASLERWRQRYDLIVLDAPPVVPVADARIMARQVDGTVFVVREGHCQRDDVLEALAMISTTGNRLLGTVFAGSRRRHGYAAYYSQYYRPGSDTSRALDVRGS